MAWNSVLRWAVPLIPGASMPDRSGAAGCALIQGTAFQSGQTYGFHLRPEPVWDRVNDPAFGNMVLEQSLAFLASIDGIATAEFPADRAGSVLTPPSSVDPILRSVA